MCCLGLLWQIACAYSTKPPNVSIITEFLGKAGKPDANGKVTFINSIEQVLHDTKVPMKAARIKEMLKEVCRGMAYLHGFVRPQAM